MASRQFVYVVFPVRIVFETILVATRNMLTWGNVSASARNNGSRLVNPRDKHTLYRNIWNIDMVVWQYLLKAASSTESAYRKSG